jgi:hypothetical protein
MFLNGVVSEFNDFSSAEIDFQTGEIRRRIVKKKFLLCVGTKHYAIKKFKKMGLVSKYSEHTGPKSKQTNNPRLERDKPKNRTMNFKSRIKRVNPCARNRRG